MTGKQNPSQDSHSQKERRRSPRYPWTVSVGVKASPQRVFQGILLNMGRGGVMLEARETILVGDPLWLRFNNVEGDQAGAIILSGRAVWAMPCRNGESRYGVAFSEGQGEFYEQLRRRWEVAHFRQVAKAFGLDFVDLTPWTVEKPVLGYVGRELAFSLNCVPIKLRGDRLMVAMAEPNDSRALEKLRLFSQCRITPVVATPSAIRDTLIQCWGAQYIPAGTDTSEKLILREVRRGERTRVMTVASSSSSVSATNLGINFAAVLNRGERRVLLGELPSGISVLSENLSRAADEHYELVILALPMDTNVSNLDWAIRADEALLIVSPSEWQKGYFYIEALFDRFVEVQSQPEAASRDRIVVRRVLEVSVVCGRVSNLRQGFKTFNRIETRVHHELDMKKPGFDIRLQYLGGILPDGRNARKAERDGVPITVLKPRCPTSRCMTHIAESLLQPARARDPRVKLGPSTFLRFFG